MKIDPSNTDPKYWAKLLLEMGLGSDVALRDKIKQSRALADKKRRRKAWLRKTRQQGP